jgi:hypothetical protein
MTTPLRPRPFYVGVLLLPIVMLVYLVASGRTATYWHTMDSVRRPGAPVPPIGDDLVTALLWFGALAPLGFAAWEIGRQHTAARRLNYSLLVGLREVVRRAFGLADAASERERAEEFARPPRDKPLAALGWGLAVALLVPGFFASAVGPTLQTPRALLWLGGTGLLIGTTIYCRRRAMAYLRDEPTSRWFREWRLLNPERYEERGRVFVRWQIAATILLPIWWLGGGATILS